MANMVLVLLCGLKRQDPLESHVPLIFRCTASGGLSEENQRRQRAWPRPYWHGNERKGGRMEPADFGVAKAYGDGVEGIDDGQGGDTLYTAKELFSSKARLPMADMFGLGLTVYEVPTRMELPGDGEYWHAMRDGTAVGLPSSRSRELGALLRREEPHR
ncbi:unnamed protein product [Pylaiella littoralis]